jgi:hypothetical protein
MECMLRIVSRLKERYDCTTDIGKLRKAYPGAVTFTFDNTLDSIRKRRFFIRFVTVCPGRRSVFYAVNYLPCNSLIISITPTKTWYFARQYSLV